MTLLTILAVSPLLLGSQPYDFKDPKQISAVSLSLDSLLEPIVGYAKGLSGVIQFDPANPGATKGKLAVDVSSIIFANDGYTATAKGYALNEKKFPKIYIEIKKVVSGTKISANQFKGVVLADFTCRGITKSKRLEVSVSSFPGKAAERTNGKHTGDLLILRTKFDVSRKAHGISEGIPDDLVGDTIQVGVAVVGIHFTDGTPHVEVG